MTRLLLGLVALNCLIIGLALAALAGLAVSPGMLAAAQRPEFSRMLAEGVRLACAAAAAGGAIGLAAGACLRRAGAWARLVPAACLLVLIVPVPALLVLPDSVADLGNADGFGGAVARAAALMVLMTGRAWHALDPQLRRAALACGASPAQAWRHAVVAPLWRAVLAGGVAGFAAALAQTRAAAAAAQGMAVEEAWHIPAGLLLAAAGAVMLRMAVGGRHLRMARGGGVPG